MPEEKINLLIANDHILYSKGLSINITNLCPERFMIDYTIDFKDTLQYLDKKQPDVLILDFQMPHGDLFETIDTIRTNWPGLKIIVNGMLMKSSITDIANFASLLTKIDGLLSFACTGEQYIRAIETVMNDGLYFDLP